MRFHQLFPEIKCVMTPLTHDVVIIGAGISGLAAAARLRDEGRDVLVLEKSRGLGGRAATRRIDSGEGEIPVDHGTQYFTARDHRFQDQVGRWQELGICFPWSEEFPNWNNGKITESNPLWQETRYACREGMSSIGKHLAEGIEVLRGHQVASVEKNAGGWLLRAEGEGQPVVQARVLFVSAPPPQALALVGRELSSEQLELVEHIEIAPCIAVMAVYPEEVPAPAWKGIRVTSTHSLLSWIGWDSSRRKSGSPGRIAVLHGSGDYSRRWLEAGPEALRAAGTEILAEAGRIAGSWMEHPRDFIVHRWKYAHSAGSALPGGFLRVSCDQSLYLIGDGYNGGRLENAWLSGTFAAEDLLVKDHSA
jgi:predicted NAD/FAD-dependent oxidoreductase